jgi:hypothetical protein
MMEQLRKVRVVSDNDARRKKRTENVCEEKEMTEESASWRIVV